MPILFYIYTISTDAIHWLYCTMLDVPYLPIGGVVSIKFIYVGTRYSYQLCTLYKKTHKIYLFFGANCSNKTKEIQSEISGKYAQI